LILYTVPIIKYERRIKQYQNKMTVEEDPTPPPGHPNGVFILNFVTHLLASSGSRKNENYYKN
jgi:hypothetical protein